MPPLRRMKRKTGQAIHISQYPSFHESGSIEGMKKQFYGENAMLVKCGQWIYNVPKEVYKLAKKVKS